MKINSITGKPNVGMHQDRCTGKSTGLALRYLSEAVLNPGKKIKIVDHHGTTGADRHLFELTKQMSHLLNFGHIWFNRGDNTLEFKLWKESDEYVEVNGKIYKELQL